MSYHLKYFTRPLCDHMGCEAGRILCREAAVTFCSYPKRAEAEAAAARLNGALKKHSADPVAHLPVTIERGECPRVEPRGEPSWSKSVEETLA